MQEYPQESPSARYQPRRFGRHARPAHTQVNKHHGFHANQVFQPLPPPTRPYPYHFTLEDFLPPDTVAAIRSSGTLALHMVGDTGGVKFPEPQQIVAMKMEDDLHRTDGPMPSFLYILGDLIYYYGEATEFYPQFYEPYSSYGAPILAIPGNHDADVAKSSSATSLAAFVENFCATAPHITPEAQEVARDAMTEPNVYWTLLAPFLTIVGIYSNVPEGGRLDGAQIAWLTDEIANAPKDAALALAMHHPIYSADAHHGGSSYLGGVIDQAVAQGGRRPDIVFSGHVHNYQRFTRPIDGYQIPYVVAGAGGYWHLHYVAKDDMGNTIATPWQVPGTDLTLEKYADTRHGFMRLEVTGDPVKGTAGTLKGTYITVPRPQEPWSNPPEILDSFTVDLLAHQLVG